MIELGTYSSPDEPDDHASWEAGAILPHQLIQLAINLILTDDTAGPLVVREVARRLPPGAAHLSEGSVGGLTLMEQCVGYDRVILVDVIQSGQARSGTFWRLTTDD